MKAIVIGFAVLLLVCVVALCVFLVPKYVEQRRVDRAKAGVQLLERAIKAYRAKNGDWPKDLEVLRPPDTYDGGASYLNAEALVDPWRRPYQYNPNLRHPQTGIPLIWSDGPEPGSEGSKIANWTP